jgi:hypothetical protein
VSKTGKEKIAQLLEDRLQFNANDLLVDLAHHGVLPFSGALFGTELDPEPYTKIIRKARETERESGVFPLCIAKGVLSWNFKGTSIQSPIFLIPCELRQNKIRNTIQFEMDEELSFLNPFLQNQFRSVLEEESDEEKIVDILGSQGIGSIDPEKQFIGNFHHHRFEIIKELEELKEISLSPALAQLLGEEDNGALRSIEWGNQTLFPSNTDQDLVFTTFQQGHSVVQGPPGTGKSQVLANLLGKILFSKRSAIVVSEKRVALEVLKRKLEERNLGDLCFISTSETISRDVLVELRNNWEQLEKSQDLRVPTNLLLSEQLRDQLQFQLDILNDDSLLGGVGFAEFTSLLNGNDLSKLSFRSDLPETNEWLSSKDMVDKIFAFELQTLLGHTSISFYRSESFLQFDHLLRSWQKDLELLESTFGKLNFGDVQQAMKKAALCQHFSNPEFLRHEKILIPDSKEQRKFIKLYKKYIQLKTAMTPFELERSNWIIAPSLIETEDLLKASQKKGYINEWRFSKRWNKLARISREKAEQALIQWRHYLHNVETISQIEVEFCELGVLKPQEEVEGLYHQIHLIKTEDYDLLRSIPLEDRQKFAAQNSTLNRIYHELKVHFKLDEQDAVMELVTRYLERFELLIHVRNELSVLPDAVLRTIAYFSSAEEMELAVLKCNYTKFIHRFPAFKDFQEGDLIDRCRTIQSVLEEESKLFAMEIRYQQQLIFQTYHEILRTPSAKLDPAQKELKQRLKKGKAILVKEFSKVRSFPSMRELFSSEAEVWIRLLKPIWLSNPAQVAKCFPMDAGLFDVAIFDEASQIPLENALGTIQRSKHILVAGDAQQMGPSIYFQSGSSDVTDLLHQASFYWKNVALKHHYRSEHPALIRFSNANFYQGGLKAYPSAGALQEAVALHFVEGGIFEDRKNKIEAKRLASYLTEHIDSPLSLGIVAFSETQLNEIYVHLDSAAKVKLEHRIEEGTCFFKALEHVQGEECDHLIISLGYAKNAEGDFHLRFGPLNTVNGPKRLNVLLTRARKKLDFFTSVRSSDFKVSDNEGVDLLRKYLMMLESNDQDQRLQFPHGLAPTVNGKKLHFELLYESITSADELIDLVRVLEMRGWEVN